MTKKSLNIDYNVFMITGSGGATQLPMGNGKLLICSFDNAYLFALFICTLYRYYSCLYLSPEDTTVAGWLAGWCC